VKLLGFDDRGKVRLSMKAVNQQTGEEIPGVTDDGPEPRGDRGDRPRGGRDRGPRREKSTEGAE
jgi:polyribonucleotide nucleotidyltransferase